jgi:hypothetical protein
MPTNVELHRIADAALVSHSTVARYIGGLGVRPRLAARIKVALIAAGFGHLVRTEVAS